MKSEEISINPGLVSFHVFPLSEVENTQPAVAAKILFPFEAILYTT